MITEVECNGNDYIKIGNTAIKKKTPQYPEKQRPESNPNAASFNLNFMSKFLTLMSYF